MYHLRIISNLTSRLSSTTRCSRRLISSAVVNLQKISAFQDKNYLVIDAKDSKSTQLKYPLVWLRDNCQCEECYHKGSSSRVLDWTTFDVDVKPVDISFNATTADVEVRWSDKHKSIHNIDWLKRREFSETARKKYLTNEYKPARQLWRKEDFDDVCKKFAYDNLIETDVGLRDWLHALSVHGVALIEGAPHDETACRRLADRVGFIRRTHYGEEFFVRNKEDTNNVAYLSTPLQIHVDLPYYEHIPGVNLLHCLVQTKSPGAFNLLTDGLWVIEQMKTRYPTEFQILTNTIVDWIDVGQEDGNKFHSLHRGPVICLDREGNLERINHSTPQRDSRLSIPLEEVEPWYRASAIFVKLLHDGAAHFKTKNGDILTFANSRLVHGRTGYTDIEGNTRHLVGAYLDWDEIYSRLRVLSASMSTNSSSPSNTK